MLNDLLFRPAHRDEADDIAALLNLAYRGNEGWTRETHIVEGERATAEAVNHLIDHQDMHLFVATMQERLAACICIEGEGGQACIGSFAVNPMLQNRGLGRQVLELAEHHARTPLGYRTVRMTVISQRPELIAYYQRRGYTRTGEVSDYPLHLGVGRPRVDGLTVEYLEKNL